MKINAKQLLIELSVLIGAFVLYGIIHDTKIFEVDIGGWMALIGVSWIAGTIFFTLAFSPIQHSLSAICLGCFLLLVGTVLHEPNPTNSLSYEERNGHSSSSEWLLIIKYKQYGLQNQAQYEFTGTIQEAEAALDIVAEQWNQENPDKPSMGRSKILCGHPMS